MAQSDHPAKTIDSARFIRELYCVVHVPPRMEKEDARKQTREALHERRKQVIRLHRKGMPVMQIVEHSGLSWCAVNAAITRYLATGVAALKPEARGKKPSSGRMLSGAQEAAVRQIICDKRPEQLKMEFALWNRCRHTADQLLGFSITFLWDKNIVMLTPFARRSPHKVVII